MNRVPMTAMRSGYRRVRDLDLEQQLAECVEQLQHPELMAQEIKASHAAMAHFLAVAARGGVQNSQSDKDQTKAAAGENAASAENAGQAEKTEKLEKAEWAEPGTSVQRPNEHFYKSREIFVVHDSSSFTCVDVGYRPLEPEQPDEQAATDGFDYVAMTCTAKPRPVLGVVQQDAKTTAYTLLLRLLSNLCDVAHESQLMQMNRRCFKGGLGLTPSIDLHLVLQEDYDDDEAPPERTPISQLSHDLAECAKACVGSGRQILPVLGDIVCLNMRPDRFDGRVRFDWRV